VAYRPTLAFIPVVAELRDRNCKDVLLHAIHAKNLAPDVLPFYRTTNFFRFIA
jgi:hypothetical protein